VKALAHKQNTLTINDFSLKEDVYYMLHPCLCLQCRIDYICYNM